MLTRALAVLFATGLILRPDTSLVVAASPSVEPARERREPATHATRGTVKAVDTRALILLRPRHRGEMTFALTTATSHEGAIVMGSTVSIRYREEDGRYIATAVAVERSRK